jgi:beta-lactamase superfamily II metal-dependent hydrolase
MCDTQPLLTVHVIGSSVGESIVIELPGGEWGVVDCHTSWLGDVKKNPTYAFLKERGVSELAFVCLTHPHSDHYRGMSEIVIGFAVKSFWRFPPFAPQELSRVIGLLKLEAIEKEREQQLRDVNDLQATLKWVEHQRRRGAIRVEHVEARKELYPAEMDFGDRSSDRAHILALAPSSSGVARYLNNLNRCFGPNEQLKIEPPDLKHNRVSSALLIIFGTTRVLLGGDVEKDEWTEAIRAFPDLGVHAVKVSHHGSPTGRCDGLWAAFSRHGKPIAVVTTYSKSSLPDQGVIEEIKQHTRALKTTCLAAITFDKTDLSRYETDEAVMKFLIADTLQANLVDPTYGICTFSFDNAGNLRAFSHSGAASDL